MASSSDTLPMVTFSEMDIINDSLSRILKWTKQFIGLLIATIMGLTAITAAAPTAGVALHRTTRAAKFVQKWHENSNQFWTTQRLID